MEGKTEIWKYQENIDLLESIGVDTVCFMGTGFSFEDIKKGATFYMTYAFAGRNRKGDSDNTLKSVISRSEHVYKNLYSFTDKFEVISTHKMFSKCVKGEQKKRKREFMIVKNLRSHTSFKFSNEEIDAIYCLLFDRLEYQDE